MVRADRAAGMLGHLQDGVLQHLAGGDHAGCSFSTPVVADCASHAAATTATSTSSRRQSAPLPGYVDPLARLRVQPGSPVMLTLLVVRSRRSI